MKIKTSYILMFFFLLYFGLRLYFSLNSDYFNNDYSYFALRQIENIANTGKPITNDSLSYSGRTFVFLPIYFYFLAFFTLFFPKMIILKIVNNLLASTVIIAVYLATSDALKNKKIALICSIVSATIPIYINETLNNISIYSILVPGSFFLLYLFMELDENKHYLNYLIFLTLVLVMCTSSSFLILFGIVIFILVSYLENISLSRLKLEYLVFFLFFFLWVNFIIYKSAFQQHGFSVIWNNTPLSVRNDYFQNIDILNALTSIGVFPFIIGIYTIYYYLFKKTNIKISIFISLFISTLILFISKLIQSELAFIFMGASLVVLFGRFLVDVFNNLDKTKLSAHENHIFIAIIILLIITQIIPSLILMINGSKLSSDYVEGFKWLKYNTPTNSVFLSTPDEGNLITYFGERKDVMDTEYMLINDAEIRLSDIDNIYTSKFKIEAIKLLDKYKIDFIILSQGVKERYQLSNIAYIDDPCFQLVYNGTIQIYRRDKILCELKNL